MTHPIGRRLLGGALAGLLPLPALAQGTPGAAAWPVPGGGPVRIILNNPAGSSADAVARAVAEAMAEVIGHQVIMENVVGGGGVVGTTRVLQARRDGMTILSTISGALIGPMVDRNLPHEIGRDLTPVSQTTAARSALLVRPVVPATNLAEFTTWAKAQRGGLNLGNFGYGSSSHIQGLLLARQLGLEVEAVTYPGTTQLIQDLLGGRLSAAFIDTGSAREFIRNGQLRPIAITGPRQVEDLPGIPTFQQLNVAGFETQIWQGKFLASGTPPAVVDAVGRALAEATKRPNPLRLINSIGFEAVGSGPEEFAAMIARDAVVWRRVIEETGVRIP